MTDRVGTSGGGRDALAAASFVAGGLEQLAAAPFWPLGDGDLAALGSLLDRVRRLAEGQTVRLLGEVAARGLPGQDGTGTPGAWLRTIAPTLRPGEAAALGKQAETLYRSRLAPELEPTRAALEAGAVRTCQARVVAETIQQLSAPNVPFDGPDAVDPHRLAAAQTMLLEGATRLSAPDLAKCGVAIRHHLDPNADERLARDEKAQQRGRCLTLSIDPSGVTFVQGLLTKECGAALRTAIDAWSAPTPAADGTADPRTAAQRRHDALHRLAETTLARGDVPTAHASPARIIVRVAAETLAAAVRAPLEGPPPVGRQPAELDDGTPISRAALARLACDADIVPILLDDLGQPLDVGRTQRLFTARQRVAITERDRHCTWPGCGAPAPWCKAHHLVYWEQGGRSDLDNAALLCGRHHRHVHATGARGQVIDGRVVWDDASAPPGTHPPDPSSDPEHWRRQLLQRLCRRWLTPEGQ
jgi:Domain of unknown function (DUF222)